MSEAGIERVVHRIFSYSIHCVVAVYLLPAARAIVISSVARCLFDARRLLSVVFDFAEILSESTQADISCRLVGDTRRDETCCRGA